MSRCFPFPPPGYAGNCANYEALILSIKLQREREENTRSEKRKERKEKKEKKRDKKQKKDESNSSFYDEKKLLHQGRPCNDKQISSPALQSAKEKLVYDCDSMEKSSLTEEHRRPCNSSDSTENSGKRKLHPAPSQNNGHVIRIRLSSRKNESTITCGVREQPCSTSGRRESLVRNDRSVLCHSSSLRSSSLLQVTEKLTEPTHSSLRVDAEVPSSSRVETKFISTVKVEADVPSTSRLKSEVPSTSRGETKVNALRDVAPMTVFASKDIALTSNDRKMVKEELLYRNLIQEWAPTSIDKMLHDLEDDDGLFETKSVDDRSAKRLESCSDEVPRYGEVAVVQPRAHYLADIGIHALPFAVPF